MKFFIWTLTKKSAAVGILFHQRNTCKFNSIKKDFFFPLPFLFQIDPSKMKKLVSPLFVFCSLEWLRICEIWQHMNTKTKANIVLYQTTNMISMESNFFFRIFLFWLFFHFSVLERLECMECIYVQQMIPIFYSIFLRIFLQTEKKILPSMFYYAFFESIDS